MRTLRGAKRSARPRDVGVAVVAAFCSLVTSACGGEEVVEWPTRGELLSVVEQAAQSEVPAVRADVLRLAARSDASELSALVDRALTDESSLVRASAIQARLQRGDRDVTEELFERLAMGSDAARRTALDLTLRYGPPPLRGEVTERSLRHSNASFRRYAFRRVVIEESAHLTVSRETLSRALDHDDPVVSAEVIDRLTERGVQGARHRIHQRLVDEDPENRAAALRVLAISPSRDAWPYLRWLHEHGEPEEQALAALALARLGEGDAQSDVIALIQSGDDTLTHLAIRALAGLPGERTDTYVRRHFDDSRPEVRSAALRTAMALSDEPADLVLFIDDDEPEIADLAAAALLAADPDAARRAVCADLLLREEPMPLLRFLWRARSADATSELEDACAAQLEPLLMHADPDVRGLATRLSYAEDDPGRVERPDPSDHEALYAVLDATLDGDPRQSRDFFRDLLRHELAIVRAGAAIGLLDSTPQ